jgi:hypothetical protein
VHHSKLVVGHKLGGKCVNVDWFRAVVKLDSDRMRFVTTLLNFNFSNLYDAGPLNIFLETVFLQNKPICTFPLGATVYFYTYWYLLVAWKEHNLIFTLLEARKRDIVIVINFFELYVVEAVINYYSVYIPHNTQPFSIELCLACS